MKKITFSILASIILAGLAYLILAFIHSSFDISKFDVWAKSFMSMIWFFISMVAVVIIYRNELNQKA